MPDSFGGAELRAGDVAEGRKAVAHVPSPTPPARDVVVLKLLTRSNVDRQRVARGILYFDGVRMVSTGECFDSGKWHQFEAPSR